MKYSYSQKLSSQLGLKKKEPSELKPKEWVIKNILNYSKALKIHKTKEIGLIETILN